MEHAWFMDVYDNCCSRNCHVGLERSHSIRRKWTDSPTEGMVEMTLKEAEKTNLLWVEEGSAGVGL